MHRWLGVALCSLLALWFLTGNVLSFVRFPSLGVRERLAGSDDINIGKLRVAPVEALRAFGSSRGSSTYEKKIDC